VPKVLIAIVCSVMMGLQVGCKDEEAAQRAQVARSFDNVVELLADASQGWAPRPDSGEDRADLQAHRRQKLEEIRESLSDRLEEGSAAQKITTRQILSEVHASAARQATRGSMTDMHVVNSRATLLMTYAVAAKQAETRAIERAGFDDAILGDLNTKLREAELALENMRAAESRLRDQAETLNQQITEQAAIQDRKTASATKLRDQAFVAEGQKRLDLELKAIDEHRLADIASTRAEELKLKKSGVESELAILTKQIEATEEARDAFRGQIASLSEQRSQRQQAMQRAEQDVEQAKAELAQAFETVNSMYVKFVRQPMEQATERAARAVELMDEAVAMADSTNRRSLRMELLGRRIDQVFVLTQRNQARRGYSSTLRMIAGYEPRAQQAFEELRTHFVETFEQATQLISVAKEQATEIKNQGGDNDELSRQADELFTVLDEFERIVRESEIEPLSI